MESLSCEQKLTSSPLGVMHLRLSLSSPADTAYGLEPETNTWLSLSFSVLTTLNANLVQEY